MLRQQHPYCNVLFLFFFYCQVISLNRFPCRFLCTYTFALAISLHCIFFIHNVLVISTYTTPDIILQIFKHILTACPFDRMSLNLCFVQLFQHTRWQKYVQNCILLCLFNMPCRLMIVIWCRRNSFLQNLYDFLTMKRTVWKLINLDHMASCTQKMHKEALKWICEQNCATCSSMAWV